MAKEVSLGSLIDGLNGVREERRLLAEQDKKLKAEYDELEAKIVERLSKEGLDKASGRLATVSVSSVVVATISDFDALCKYVKRTGNFQLFQRRISDPAFRELMTLKGVVPGLEPFEKQNLNLRTLS